MRLMAKNFKSIRTRRQFVHSINFLFKSDKFSINSNNSIIFNILKEKNLYSSLFLCFVFNNAM